MSGQLTILEAPLILMVISIGHAWFSSIDIRPDSSMSIPIFMGLGITQWIGADASVLILVIAASSFRLLYLPGVGQRLDWAKRPSGPVLLLMPAFSGFLRSVCGVDS